MKRLSSTLSAIAIGGAIMHASTTLVRARLADQALARRAPDASESGRITIVQPILSGDPALSATLTENLRNAPADVSFCWLVDTDDAEGLRITRELSSDDARVKIVVCAPWNGQGNPKVAKLVTGLQHCAELVCVLDDDTVLPPGLLNEARRWLTTGDLVCGNPVYRARPGVWSRLVAAWVNGSSLITHLPIAELVAPPTINGMWYLLRRSDLEAVGGFEMIAEKLCDDYEIAKLYRDNGFRIVQSPLVHPVTTTITGASHYLSLMRRWMLFTRRLLAKEAPPGIMGLVVVPAFLPLVCLTAALASRRPMGVVIVIAELGFKSLVLAKLRKRSGVSEFTGPVHPGDTVLEAVADLSQPLHLLTSLWHGDRVRWRSRDLALHTDRVSGH